MKRKLHEWATVLGLGAALTLVGTWAVSRFGSQPPDFIEFRTSGNVQHNINLIIDEGAFTISNQFESDASGRPRPLIIEFNQLTKADIQRGDRAWQLAIPGFEFHYYRNAVSGFQIYSLKQSLLIPAGLFLILAALFHIKRRPHPTTTSGTDRLPSKSSHSSSSAQSSAD